MSEIEPVIENLKEVISSGDRDALLKILEENPNINLNEKYDDECLIHLGVRSSAQIIETLIAHGADVNARDGDDENTALQLAVRDNRILIVETLLRCNADVNLKNKQGATALHIAINRNRFVIGKQLLRKNANGGFTWNVDIDQKDDKGESARDIIMKNNDELWRNLIENHQPSATSDDCVQSNKIENFNMTVGGLTGVDGNIFQVLMFVVICTRARKAYRDFQIMTEIEAAGKLDDIVIRYLENGEWHWRFIQLKHKNSSNDDKNKISLKELKKKKGQFDLNKYIDSIIDILNNELFKNDIAEDFIICTTASLEESEDSVFESKNSRFKRDRLLFLRDDRFEGKSSQLIRKEFDKMLNVKDEKGKKTNKSVLGEICEKFFFVTSYPNLFLLKEIILRENNHLQNSEVINNFLINKVLDHILKAKGKPMNKSHVDEIMGEFEGHLSIQQCWGLSKQNISKIQTLNIEFKCPIPQLETFLVTTHIREPLIVRTSRADLALLSIMNELKSKDLGVDNFLVIDLRNFESKTVRKTLYEALKYLKGTICVFKECQLYLEEILIRNFNIRIISIEKSSEDPEGDRKLSFENLTEKAQDTLRNRYDCFEDEEKINLVGYIERVLTEEWDGDMSSMNFTEESDSFSRVFNEQEFFQRIDVSKNRVVVVVGDPGMGKSLWLRKLKIEMQKHHQWVILLNLNDFTLNQEKQPFHLSKANFPSDDKQSAVQFLIGMLKSVQELKEDLLTPLIFDMIQKSLLSETASNLPRPVILLDGFDEISPTYDENVFRLIEALNLTRASQIWLSTRPHEAQEISNRLGSTNYTLAPFSVENKINYLLSHCRTLGNEIENNTTDPNFTKINLLTLFRTVLGDTEDLSDKFRNYEIDFLQLLHLDEAEVRTPIFKYTISDNFDKMLENPLQFQMLLNLCGESELLTDMNITEIYDRFIERKFKIFFQKDTVSDGGSAAQFSHRQLYEDQYFKLALNVLFPERKDTSAVYLEHISRVGLITKRLGGYTFLHRSYAEFFTAKYLLKSEFFHDVSLMSMVLIEETFSMLRTFLNDELKKNNYSKVWFLNRNYDGTSPLQKSKPNGENVIHVAAKRGHIEIIKYLQDLISDISIFKELATAITEDKETVLDKAAWSLDYKNLFLLFKEILGEIEFSNLLRNSRQYKKNIISNASRSGKYEEMLKFFEFSYSNETIEDLLYFTDKHHGTISSFVAMFGDLRKLIEALAAYRRRELIEKALKHQDKKGKTIFHHLAETKQFATTCNIFIHHLGEEEFRKFVFIKDDNGETCLHEAASSNRFRDVLSFLKKYFTDFEILDSLAQANNDGNTVMHIGAFGPYFESTVKTVFDIMGKDTFKSFVARKNNDGFNSVYLNYKERGINDTVSFFQKHFNDIEIVEFLKMITDDSATLLDVAAECNLFESTANGLMEIMGQDKFREQVFKRNIDGDSWLITMLQYGDLNHVVSFLKRHFNDSEIVENLTTLLTSDGKTMLHFACASSNVVGNFKVLLSTIGEDKFKNLVFKKDNNGLTCLHSSAKYGSMAEMVSFLQNYFDNSEIFEHLTSCTNDGYTIFHVAAHYGYFETVADVFISITNMKKFQSFLLKKDDDGLNCIHVAALCGDIDKMVSFLQKYYTTIAIGENLYLTDNDGNTILHFAALSGDIVSGNTLWSGHFELIIKMLINITGEERFKIILAQKNKHGQTCLHKAAQSRLLGRLVRLLKEYFTDAEIKESLSMRDNNGNTIMHFAANNMDNSRIFSISDNIVSLIEESVNIIGKERLKTFVIQKNKNGRTCFHIAAESQNLPNMVCLLKKYFTDIEITENLCMPDNDGNTIMHFATFKKEMWHSAIYRNHFESTINELIDVIGLVRFRTIVVEKNKKGRNCFHTAAQSGILSEMLRLFKKYFTDTEITENLSMLDNDSNTIMHFVAYNKDKAHSFIYRNHFVSTIEKLIDFMGEEGLKTIAVQKNKNGRTCFHTAAQSGILSEMICLFKKYFTDTEITENVCMTDNDGNTILQIATNNGNLKIMAKILIDIMGGDKLKDFVFEKNAMGWTILNVAAEKGNIFDIVSFIRKMFTDFEIIDKLTAPANDGATIVHIAILYGHFENVAKILINIMGEEKFKEFVLKTDNNGWTCLHYAASQGNINEVVLFLQKQFTNLEIVDILLTPDNDADTIITVGAANKHFDSVAITLIDTIGEDKFKDFVFKQTNDGQNCFHSASKTDNMRQVVSVLQKYFTNLQIVENLIMPTKDGDTILHIGACKGHFISIAQTVIDIAGLEEFKNFVFIKNDSGKTCLNCASEFGNIDDVVSFLHCILPKMKWLPLFQNV